MFHSWNSNFTPLRTFPEPCVERTMCFHGGLVRVGTLGEKSDTEVERCRSSRTSSMHRVREEGKVPEGSTLSLVGTSCVKLN